METSTAPRTAEPSVQAIDISRNRVTVRSLLAGAVLCGLFAALCPYTANIVSGSLIALDHTAVGATAMLFGLVVCANAAARWLENRFARRAVLAGTILAAAVGGAIVTALNVLPPAGPLSSNWLVLGRIGLVVGGALWLLFAVVVASRLVETVWARGPWLSLSRAEVLTIFAMLLIASTVVTMGLVLQLIPTLPAGEYYANPGNRWETLLFPHIPAWARVSDRLAVQGFFEGLYWLDEFVAPEPGRFAWPMAQGAYEVWEQLRQIPWAAWTVPLLAWGVYLLALYVFMIAAMVLVRRQWMDREILAYPLARLPLDMTRVEDESPPRQRLVAPLLRNPMLWLGVAIPVVYTSLQAMHFYWPTLPAVPKYWSTDVMYGQATFWIWPSFVVIGFTYLINTRVAFSIWSLALAGVLISGWLALRGYMSPEYLGMYGSVGKPFMYHLGMGALLALAAGTLIGSWRYFREVLGKALTGRGPDDSQEILSYRAALLACVVCLAVMLGWLMAFGMSWWAALLFWSLTMLIFYGITRIVVEAGLGACVAPGISPFFMTSKIGTQVMTHADVTAMGMQFPYVGDIRTFTMVAAAYSLKITEEIRDRRRLIFWGMLIALVVTLVVSAAMTIYLAYVYQGTSLNMWFFRDAPQQGFLYAAKMVGEQPGANLQGWVWSIAGVVLMVVLIVGNRSFLNWPIHPIGLAVMGIWIMEKFWFSVFVAWLVKALLLKYGGQKAYMRVMPVFLGMILGQCVIAVVWLLIDYVTGVIGNMPFWI